jgi:hypothetical protein
MVAEHEIVTLYGLSLGIFVALAVDDFEVMVSCARCVNDFSGVCYNLTAFYLVFLW